jgi:hypothetical protein
LRKVAPVEQVDAVLARDLDDRDVARFQSGDNAGSGCPVAPMTAMVVD